MHIREMQEQVHQTAVEHGWYEGELNVPEKLALIHSEVSEALEDYRDLKLEESLPIVFYEAAGKPYGFMVELADAVIRIADLAAAIGGDLEHAVVKKMAYNKTRPYRHGGKRV